MVLREECIRNAFYALLMDYLIRNNFKVNNVSFSNAFPEFHAGGRSGYADLVLFEYLGSGEVSPFLLLEFKATEGALPSRWDHEHIIHDLSSSYKYKVEKLQLVLQLIEPLGQLSRYCSNINPSYSGYIEFHKRSASFNIVVMEGCDLTNIVYSKTAGTIDDKIVDDILRTLTSRKAIINKKYKLNDLIQRYRNLKYSFEDFIKGEIMRGLMKDYVVSTECYTFVSDHLSGTSQKLSQKHYGYPDVIIYDIPPQQYPDVIGMCILGGTSNQLPFIVMEVKSSNDRDAYLQAYRYGVSMSSDYLATVIPYGRTMLTFKIYDTQSGTLRSSFTIPFINYGNRFMLKAEMLRNKLGSLPRKVRDCNNVPNGFYNVNRLVQLGAKIVPISSFNPIKLALGTKRTQLSFDSNLISAIGWIYECATFSPDDPIVLASECEFPRLALVYKDGKKPSWCEFQKGVLAKCDVDVIAVYLAYPCSTICVAKYMGSI